MYSIRFMLLAINLKKHNYKDTDFFPFPLIIILLNINDSMVDKYKQGDNKD